MFGNIAENVKGFGNLWGGIIKNAYQNLTPAGVAQKNTDKTIAANKTLAEYQYSKDLEMWNKGNLYNSPIEQMKRLKDAGLNPNLIYGSGGATTTAGQLPHYNAPTANYNYKPPIDVPGLIGQYQDIQIKNAQIDNLKAQRGVIEQSELLKEFANQFNRDTALNKRTMTGLQVDTANQKLRQLQNLAPYQLEAAGIKNRESLANIDKLMAGTAYTREQTDWIASKAVMNLLGSGTQLMKGLLPAFGKGAKGTLNKGLGREVQKDAEKWRQFDKAQRRSWNR